MQEPTTEQCRPPLTRWAHTWRIVLVLTISGVGWFEVAVRQWEQARTLFWLDLSLGLVAFGLMFLRRRWPVAIAVVLTLIGGASYASAGPAVLAIVSMATRRRLQEIIPLSVLGMVMAVVFASYQPIVEQPWWLGLGFGLAATVAIAATGMYIGSRRELIWTLHDRARRAEEGQSMRVDQARTNERARIAREMHDVLAHRISLVTMHAGALAYRTDLTPEEIRESATLIQTKAHEALNDLRQVLGVLRDDADALLDRPQPTYDDLPGLVDEAREAGMRVQYDAARGLEIPDAVGRTLYRVVQEGLTNARKHAPHTHAQVAIHRDDDEVRVTVSNATALGAPLLPGAGLGLVGLRERVELAGGTLRYGTSGGRFTLSASLPT